MNKAELIKALDSVIANVDIEINNTENAFTYVKLDVRKKTFEEVRAFVAKELEEAKSESKKSA